MSEPARHPLSLEDLPALLAAALPDRLLRMEQVSEQVALSPSRVYELIAEGRFPRPRKIDGASRWRQSEVGRWIAELPDGG